MVKPAAIAALVCALVACASTPSSPPAATFAQMPPPTSPASKEPPSPPATNVAPEVPPTIPEGPSRASVTVLVMPLNAEAALKGSAHALDEMILGAVTHFKRYQVMGPEDLNAMLGVEKLKDAMGCDDVSCATEIGGALGAPYILTGELTHLGEEVVLSLRLMDVKKSHVMARGTARGGTSADALTSVMAQAVGEAFNLPVADVAHVRQAPTQTRAESPAQTGLDYQTVMTELSKRAANKDYARLMQDLDSYATQPIAAPPGTDVREVLSFWRAFACYMAQKPACVKKTAAEYLAQWPDGMYASTVKTYAEQLDLLERQRAARDAQLAAQLEQIDAKHRANQITDEQALELSASACTAVMAYQRAAKFYEQLMERATNDEPRWFALAEQLAVTLEENQAYAHARDVLQRAQARNGQLFHARGMGLILARLPR